MDTWSVVGGTGAAAEANPHAAWRFRTAQRVEVAYGPRPQPAVVVVAGSVGSGFADRWSDLEVDCYWQTAPSDDERSRPIRMLGAGLDALWEYDEDEEEWSEGCWPARWRNWSTARAARSFRPHDVE